MLWHKDCITLWAMSMVSLISSCQVIDIIIPGVITIFCQSFEVIINTLTSDFCSKLVTNFQFCTTSGAKLILKICEESGNDLNVSTVMFKTASRTGTFL